MSYREWPETHINFRIIVQKLQKPIHAVNHSWTSKLLFIGHQLSHRVFRRAALRHVSDFDNHLLQLTHAINVHESVQRRGAKVVVKASRWRRFRKPVDPFELDARSRGSISEYAKLDFEVLDAYKIETNQ